MDNNSKYKHGDKVRPLKDSFIYVIDDSYIDDENNIIYIVHMDNSSYKKVEEFNEEDLTFVGFGY